MIYNAARKERNGKKNTKPVVAVVTPRHKDGSGEFCIHQV
eukprot:CAMPEP_0185022600 /NCGR_PEP_ID=MMETSP1103-20130426/5303_1 /TAXON_ID=36769 /ORGANISM="Paraphysomonas bandaiensis, Strain Caron Lab Isolate" /LENGTH=39 /DNA_ID= /DNA_START= /DNA_END= /DNA_ORIENTATION=